MMELLSDIQLLCLVALVPAAGFYLGFLLFKWLARLVAWRLRAPGRAL